MKRRRGRYDMADMAKNVWRSDMADMADMADMRLWKHGGKFTAAVQTNRNRLELLHVEKEAQYSYFRWRLLHLVKANASASCVEGRYTL